MRAISLVFPTGSYLYKKVSLVESEARLLGANFPPLVLSRQFEFHFTASFNKCSKLAQIPHTSHPIPGLMIRYCSLWTPKESPRICCIVIKESMRQLLLLS